MNIALIIIKINAAKKQELVIAFKPNPTLKLSKLTVKEKTNIDSKLFNGSICSFLKSEVNI